MRRATLRLLRGRDGDLHSGSGTGGRRRLRCQRPGPARMRQPGRNACGGPRQHPRGHRALHRGLPRRGRSDPDRSLQRVRRGRSPHNSRTRVVAGSWRGSRPTCLGARSAPFWCGQGLCGAAKAVPPPRRASLPRLRARSRSSRSSWAPVSPSIGLRDFSNRKPAFEKPTRSP
jgi:hypothetical protein